jgi:hypothetical protein
MYERCNSIYIRTDLTLWIPMTQNHLLKAASQHHQRNTISSSMENKCRRINFSSPHRPHILGEFGDSAFNMPTIWPKGESKGDLVISSVAANRATI